jgi:hypothetical protein
MYFMDAGVLGEIDLTPSLSFTYLSDTFAKLCTDIDCHLLIIELVFALYLVHTLFWRRKMKDEVVIKQKVIVRRQKLFLAFFGGLIVLAGAILMFAGDKSGAPLADTVAGADVRPSVDNSQSPIVASPSIPPPEPCGNILLPSEDREEQMSRGKFFQSANEVPIPNISRTQHDERYKRYVRYKDCWREHNTEDGFPKFEFNQGIHKSIHVGMTMAEVVSALPVMDSALASSVVSQLKSGADPLTLDYSYYWVMQGCGPSRDGGGYVCTFVHASTMSPSHMAESGATEPDSLKFIFDGETLDSKALPVKDFTNTQSIICLERLSFLASLGPPDDANATEANWHFPNDSDLHGQMEGITVLPRQGQAFVIDIYQIQDSTRGLLV